MAVKRMDMSSAVLDMLHTNTAAVPAPLPINAARRAPAPADLLATGPGDAAGRSTYFEHEIRQRDGGPMLLCAGATFHDYRDTSGGKIHRLCVTMPPSSAERIRAATGGKIENAGAALLALAEYGLEQLTRQGVALAVQNAPDPWRSERLAARRAVAPRPPDRKKN